MCAALTRASGNDIEGNRVGVGLRDRLVRVHEVRADLWRIITHVRRLLRAVRVGPHAPHGSARAVDALVVRHDAGGEVVGSTRAALLARRQAWREGAVAKGRTRAILRCRAAWYHPRLREPSCGWHV